VPRHPLPGDPPFVALKRLRPSVLAEQPAAAQLASFGASVLDWRVSSSMETADLIEDVDPFGSLRRAPVFRGVALGLAAARAVDAAAALYTSHGGAGLGLHRVSQVAATTVFSVTRRKETRVAACFDLRLAAGDVRGLPHSLRFTAQDP